MQFCRFIRSRTFAAVVLMNALLAVSGAVSSALDNTRWGSDYFPNVDLTTQDGAKVHFYDDLLKGKMVVIELIYTHCVDACPLETARLAQVQRLLGDRVGKEIFFYSISIDPERDTPAELKAYAEKYHAGPGWLFLTGKKGDIDLISKKLGLYSAPNPRNRDGHAPAILVGNESTGQWMRNSATDNPKFLSILIGDWLNSWKNRNGEAQKSYAEASPININNQGQYIFATHCAACHTIGKGDKIGPDLLGVTQVRDRAWLMHFILRPDQMIANGDPIAVNLFKKYKQVNMPNLRLADIDIKALIDYLEAQSPAGKTLSPVATEKSEGMVAAHVPNK
jgi:protein SCO1